MIDIDLPEVKSFQQQPRFFKKDGKDFVEISFLGTKDTLVKKVTPDIMAKFQAEWNAYCDGRPLERRKGTPLTELPEITEQMAEDFVRRNLHTLEELAVLNDHQCQALGHGLITLRKKALALVQQRQFAERDKAHKAITAQTAAVAVQPDSKEVDDLKAIVAEQGKKIDQLVDVLSQFAKGTQGNYHAEGGQLAKRKPGRPKKEINGTQLDS